MSKMKMPEMSVVRFNESDVIVASVRFRIAHFADNGKSNGTITDSTAVYGWPSTSGSGITDITTSPYYNSSNYIQTKPDGLGRVLLSELISVEGSNGWGSDGARDGVYVYNSSSSTYEWSHQ